MGRRRVSNGKGVQGTEKAKEKLQAPVLVQGVPATPCPHSHLTPGSAWQLLLKGPQGVSEAEAARACSLLPLTRVHLPAASPGAQKPTSTSPAPFPLPTQTTG